MPRNTSAWKHALTYEPTHWFTAVFVLSPGKLSPPGHGQVGNRLIFFAEHLAKGWVGLLLACSTLQVTLRKQVVITIHFGKLQLKNNQPSLPSGSLFGVRSQADLECPCFVYLYSQTLPIFQPSETFTPAEMKSVFTGVGWTRLLRRYTEPSKGRCKKG